VFCCRVQCNTAEVELAVVPKTTEGFWSPPGRLSGAGRSGR
jgi:hypothetical protein